MEIVVLDIWHQINGQWTHICQTFDGKDVFYYTNGLRFSSTLVETLYKL